MSTSDYRAIAEYYDAENEHSGMLQDDIPFFLSTLPKRRRLDILDLCCGTARSSIPIAQAGHRVVGIDYARDMLVIAKRKRESVGLTDKQLSLKFGNARQLNLGRRFEYVCIFFNTFLNFPTLARQDEVLKRVSAHLKPRGRVWIDVFNPDLALLHGPPRRKVDPSLFFVHSLGRTVYRDVDIRSTPAAQLQHITFDYRWFEGDGTRERHKRIKFDITWIMPREMQLLLERNGFEIEAMYGDHHGGELDDNSPRLIVQGRKTR